MNSTTMLLKTAIAFASEQGYQVRQEFMDSPTTGMCEYAGKKWIFLDLSQNSMEQLHDMGTALICQAGIPLCQLPIELQQHWQQL